MASLEGQTLGKYRVLEPLGRGGMARVYRIIAGAGLLAWSLRRRAMTSEDVEAA